MNQRGKFQVQMEDPAPPAPPPHSASASWLCGCVPRAAGGPPPLPPRSVEVISAAAPALNEEALSPLELLPNQLLSLACEYLEAADLGRFACVSRRTNEIACEPRLWSALYVRDFVLPSQEAVEAERAAVAASLQATSDGSGERRRSSAALFRKFFRYSLGGQPALAAATLAAPTVGGGVGFPQPAAPASVSVGILDSMSAPAEPPPRTKVLIPLRYKSEYTAVLLGRLAKRRGNAAKFELRERLARVNRRANALRLVLDVWWYLVTYCSPCIGVLIFVVLVGLQLDGRVSLSPGALFAPLFVVLGVVLSTLLSGYVIENCLFARETDEHSVWYEQMAASSHSLPGLLADHIDKHVAERPWARSRLAWQASMCALGSSLVILVPCKLAGVGALADAPWAAVLAPLWALAALWPCFTWGSPSLVYGGVFAGFSVAFAYPFVISMALLVAKLDGAASFSALEVVAPLIASAALFAVPLGFETTTGVVNALRARRARRTGTYYYQAPRAYALPLALAAFGALLIGSEVGLALKFDGALPDTPWLQLLAPLLACICGLVVSGCYFGVHTLQYDRDRFYRGVWQRGATARRTALVKLDRFVERERGGALA